MCLGGLLSGVHPKRASFGQSALCTVIFLTTTIPFRRQDGRACTGLPWPQPGIWEKERALSPGSRTRRRCDSRHSTRGDEMEVPAASPAGALEPNAWASPAPHLLCGLGPWLNTSGPRVSHLSSQRVEWDLVGRAWGK